MKISKIITDKYKLRIPPTVYYDLLADVAEAEEEQEPTTKNDFVLIYTEGLDEGIRCAMCTNSMKSDRGCDGSCVVDKNMYKAVMETIEKHIQPTTDCVDRREVINRIFYSTDNSGDVVLGSALMERIEKLPSVTPKIEPKIGHCKDCKWWKDSNGAFRRGIGAESICRINTDIVYQGEGYCYLFEPQESEE